MLYPGFGGKDCVVKYSGRDSNYRKSAQCSLEYLYRFGDFKHYGMAYVGMLVYVAIGISDIYLALLTSVHILKNLGSLWTDLSTTIAVNYQAWINYLAPSCFP